MRERERETHPVSCLTAEMYVAVGVGETESREREGGRVNTEHEEPN